MTEPPHRRGQDHDGLLHRPAITPALTAEEWAKRHGGLEQDAHSVLHWGEHVFDVEHDDCDAIVLLGRDVEEPKLHAIAALALYGQPFGFTYEDALILRQIAEDFTLDGFVETADALSGIAARIAALLPPA